MSSIDDPCRFNKIYVIPSDGKTYSRQPRMGFPKKGSIVILAPLKSEPLKSKDGSNSADSPRNIRTIDMSEVQLFRPSTKPSDHGKQPIHYSINRNPSKEMEHKNTTPENTSTEVVWLPTATQKGEKTLALENENIQTLHSENESDEDQSSVSDQSDNENTPLNSSRDTHHRYYSNENKISKNNDDSKPYRARSKEKDLNWRSEKLNPSDRKRTFNPKDILKQLKVINSTEIPKPGTYISVSRREYCREWLKHQALSGFDQDQKLFNFLTSKLKPSRALKSRKYLKSLVSSHSYQLSHMWTESGKNEDTFYKEYSNWLDGSSIKLAASRPIDTQPTSNIPDKLVRIDITTNADAFKFLKKLEPAFEADGLIKLIPCTNLTPEQNAKLNDFCTRYSADMKFKWLTSNNDEGVFFKKFEWWLKLNIKWPVFLKDVLPIPKKTGPETVENEEFNILSNFSEELVMKMMINSKIETIEKILASKCTKTGKDISKIIHRVIHHPEDAALIAGVMSDHRECCCYPQLADKKIPDKDKKFKPPSQVQKEIIKMTIEKLKDTMPTPKDPLNDDYTTESPIHKKHAASAEAHQTMLNKILSRLKVTNLPVPNPIPIISKVNHAEIISRVNNAIVIHDENDKIETNQANEGGDKIVERGVFKFKVISPAKSNRQLNQPITCLNTVSSTAEESLHNADEEMIVHTPIDNDDNFETPIEQTNENNHEDLEFGPVLDKLIFIQPKNLSNGTIIRLPNNKEAVVCKVSNCSATVLIPKFIKKSGPNVRVRKSNYKIKRLNKRATIDEKYTASSKISTEKQISSNINHGILQDFPKRSQESFVQMQTASRKVSGNTVRKEEIIASVKFKPPSQTQKQILKMTVDKLKELMPTPRDVLDEERDTTVSPIHKKLDAPAEAHQNIMNQILSRFKVTNLPVPIRKEVNQAEIISTVNDPIVIHDEDSEIETNRANEGGDKIVERGIFKFKVVSPVKSSKQLNQPIVCLNTVISTAEESLHNSNEKMIVDTSIDNDDNFETPTEQTNENNHEDLEFGPVLDKQTNGTIIRLSKNNEAIICKDSNRSATVLIRKCIKKSGPTVCVKKSNYKITNLPVLNPVYIRKEVNQAKIKSTVNDPIVIHDEDNEIETNQANEGGDKIVERGIFKFKVVSPVKSSKQLNQPIVCLNTVISTAEESLHNSNEKMIVDTSIDNDDNFETPTEQTNENNHEDLEFGPVLDKQTNGTIIRLSKNNEAIICKDSNRSATVLIRKCIKKSGPTVCVKKSNYKITNLPVPNPVYIRKEVNQAKIKSTVNDPIVIHDEDNEIETNQANEGGDKIVERDVFKLKVTSPAKSNKPLNQSIVCLNTVSSTEEESLHNSDEEMIVDTPIDNDDSFETPTEQRNENNHEDLECRPVLDKLIFIQPINLPNGTIIRLSNNKEAVVCKVSNCSATVLIPKFINKSGPTVRMKKLNYEIKRLVKKATIDKKKY